MEKSYPNVRKSIVELVATGMSISEVSRTTGLSRKAVYKWIARAEAEGIAGLTDRSRARHSYEERFDDERAEWLVALRLKNENWGPTTLLYYAHKHRPNDSWPSKSTVATLLHRRGLILPRRPRATHRMALLPVGPPPLSPNARWTMDFKGDFRLGDRTLVKPFTLRDGFSRMILDVHVTVSTSYEVVKLRLEKAFRAYGMPDEIQSDNGPPFASTGLGLLSALSVWLIRHDVLPVLSRPGKPQDNGAHERMHRDYKADTTRPPAHDILSQQRRSSRWKRAFNEVRPHHALGGDVPREHWTPSPRRYTPMSTPPEYPSWWETRRADINGEITWHNQPLACGKALRRQTLGLEPIDDGVWRIHFAKCAIGIFNERLGLRVLDLRRQKDEL